MDVLERIKEQVENNPIIIYMKGTPQFPQCGFSSRGGCVAGLWREVCVRQSWRIRRSSKILPRFADWPTFPAGVYRWRADRRLRYHPGNARQWRPSRRQSAKRPENGRRNLPTADCPRTACPGERRPRVAFFVCAHVQYRVHAIFPSGRVAGIIRSHGKEVTWVRFFSSVTPVRYGIRATSCGCLRGPGLVCLVGQADSAGDGLCAGHRGGGEGAQCVVVLWSQRSIRSRWVHTEAAAGAGSQYRRDGDHRRYPERTFRSSSKRLQAVNLSDWRPGAHIRALSCWPTVSGHPERAAESGQPGETVVRQRVLKEALTSWGRGRQRGFHRWCDRRLLRVTSCTEAIDMGTQRCSAVRCSCLGSPHG